MSTKDKLIEIAAKLFAERGFEGVSVRDIIGEAGTNLGAVTYHFGTKEELFAEVLKKKTEPMRKIVQQIIAKGGTPEMKIRAIFEGYAFHILHKEPSLKVLFAEVLCSKGRKVPDVTVEANTWRNRIFKDLVRDGVEQGMFRKVDVECAAWCFFGMLSSYIYYQPLVSNNRMGAYDESYVRRIVNAALDLFFNGLKVRGSEKSADGKKKKISFRG